MYQLENELPDFMKDLPEIKRQITILKGLSEDPCFTVVVVERTDKPLEGLEVADGYSRIDAPSVTEVMGYPGQRPATLQGLGLSDLAEFLLSAKSVALLTGAGISTHSGISDYRGKGGLYDTLDPSLLTATEEERDEMKQDPQRVAHIGLYHSNPLPLLETKRPFILSSANKKWRPTIGHFLARLLQGDLKAVAIVPR